jgi:hypothetical protein
MNLGPLSSCFFFNSGTKKALSLSLHEKVISKPIKNDASSYGINLKKIIQQSSHKKFSDVILAGRRTHKNKSFFMGLDHGKSKCYGFGLWE